MEMHQVRYFLAVARTLNFTRAAEECHVAQPSLTRAIKQLEGELGGDLFRRERPAAQLTELGQRMLPLLKQCHDSALGARDLATAMKSGHVGALRLALSRTIDISLIVPKLQQLQKHFKGLELKLLRGTAAEISEYLKKGDAELAIAAGFGDEWERLDRWPLFTENFLLLANSKSKLAAKPEVALADLAQESMLMRNYCEQQDETKAAMRAGNIAVDRSHEVSSERDLIALVEADIGVAFAPRSVSIPASLKRAPVAGLEVSRTVYLYGVAGRQRTAPASTVMKMLRSADWSPYID
jgi:DNA-binding transcriptional LysR family regulator